MIKIGYGKDSHAFDFNDKEKKLILGGVEFPNQPALAGNSDADVVLHAITNAISGVTCKNILGPRADALCLEQGITDSRVYLEEALKDAQEADIILQHISISIECKFPKITPMLTPLRESLSQLLGLPQNAIGITATTGEGLTPFGQGLGIECEVVVTACAKD